MLAEALRENGRVEEAINMQLEVVSLYRRLCTDGHERHGRELVTTLCTYGDTLRAAGRTGDACLAIVHTLYHYRQMMITHYEVMHAHNPVRYEEYFASVLCLLDCSLHNGAHAPKAYSAFNEAVSLYHGMYGRNPIVGHSSSSSAFPPHEIDQNHALLIDI